MWHQLTILMMSVYLLADMLAGFAVIYLGVDLKISLIYKTPLVFLLLILLGQQNLKAMLWIVSGILFFFIGPFYQLALHGKTAYFVYDFALILKIMTPIIVFLYFRSIFKINQQFASNSIERILWISFFILSFNFILGALGLGKSTYQLTGDEGAGSTGLILAGNELGGAFLVTFGFALHYVWNNGKLPSYILLGLFTVICGISVATKTTMIASVLIVFLIPIANERNRLYFFTRLKVIIFVPLISIGAAIAYLIVDILEQIGLYDRIMWFYNQKGLMGILLSGRDDMAESRAEVVLNKSNLFEQLFGQGQALGQKDLKGFVGVEIDSIDIFNLYGVFTLVALTSFYFWGVYRSHRNTIRNESDIAPYVFIISFLLLCLSQLSGHIWTSGTIGILLGAMTALNLKKMHTNRSTSK
ncbi:hypothetical protein [Thalassotalea fusca]